MFGLVLPPGVDTVRIFAYSGRAGKPPCLWEGSPSADQSTVESAMGRDRRILMWLKRNHLIQNGVATLNLQIDCFSQGKRIESYNVVDVPLLIGERKRKQQGTSETVVIRAMDLTENLVATLKTMLDERDTVIGRLVDRALKTPEPSNTAEQLATAKAAPPDAIGDLLDKGTKFLALAQGFRSMRDRN